MIKIDLSPQLQLLDGTKVVENAQPVTQNKLVARFLSESRSGDALKCWDLATRLFKEPVIEVDESDFEFIMKVVQEADTIPLFKAPILRSLRFRRDGK